MDDKIVTLAAQVLKLSEDETKKNSKTIPEIRGYYFWNPLRGGGAVIIDENGEKLAAGSAVNYSALLQAFLDGKRN